MNDLQKFEERSEKSVAVVDANSPAALMRIALMHGTPLEKVEKMLELQIKWEKNEAKKDYYQAVANFKENAPSVKKDKYNKQFNSWYTSLGNLLDTYNPCLGEEGLSISFRPPTQDDQSMTVECRLAHRMGHVESVSMTAPIDSAPVGKTSGKAARNPIQNIKSTFTYLRSATCEAILGVAGTDASHDDNGNTAGVEIEYITKDQLQILENLIIEKDSDVSKICEYMKVAAIEEVLAKDYKKALVALKAQKPAIRDPGQEG